MRSKVSSALLFVFTSAVDRIAVDPVARCSGRLNRIPRVVLAVSSGSIRELSGSFSVVPPVF
jgi:hypothetical protein